MSTSARELNSLWELIDAGSYKQASVKINKELKKSPNHSYWLSVSAFVAACQNKHKEALDTAKKVSSLGPTSVSILNILRTIFVKYGEDQEINSLFELAARKAPTDTQILELWQDSMIDRDSLKGFVKVSMAQQKVLQTRKSTLQVALSIYLCYNGTETLSPEASESERKIYPMLASRMLQKIEPFENAQEGYVNALVLGMVDSSRQIDYLMSEQVRNWESLDLIVLLLNILEKSQKWELLFTEAIRLLETNALDNWLYWTAINKAAIKLANVTDTNYIETARKFIESFTPASRNSRLALVDLYASISSNTTSSQLMNSAFSYFTALGNKRCAYEDLKKYTILEVFDSDAFAEWLDKDEQRIQAETSLDWKVNTAKFKRLFQKNSTRASSSIKPRDEDSEIYNLGNSLKTTDFYYSSSSIDNLIELYNNSKPLLTGKDPKDYFSGDDFLLMASSAILSNDQDNYRLEKAAILLETAAISDKHQFYVRLWLIRLYVLLGAFVKAQGHYDTLAIKSIQNENLSYSLFTRCGTLYPIRNLIHRVVEDEQRQKQKKEDNLFVCHLNEISEYTKYALSKSSYTQIEGLIDLHRKINYSLNSRLLEIENVKIHRLADPYGNATLSALEKDFDCEPSTLYDNRDFSTIANSNFESMETEQKCLRISDLLTVGPKQGPNWVKAFTLRENIIRNLITASIIQPDYLRELVISLKTIYLETSSEEFTEEEIWSLEVVALLAASSEDKLSEKSYTDISKKIEQLQIFSLTEVEHLSWKWLHRAFTILETCKIVTGFIARLKAYRHQFKFNAKASDDLLKHVKVHSQVVQQKALDLKNSRNKRYQRALDELAPWAEERGISSSFVENILDGIGATQDKSLTILRSISI